MIVQTDTVQGHADSARAWPDAAIVVPVLRAGVRAQVFCRTARQADVAAVFDRCIYLRAGNEFVCIGEPDIGNGPLTLIVDLDDPCRLRDFRLRPGQPAHVSTQHIAIGDTVVFSFDHCETWCPQPWRQPQSRLLLPDVGDAIVRLAQDQAPVDGLGRLICPQQQGAVITPLARVARPRMARFSDWLRAEFDAPRVVRDASPVLSLIGLGPGLTPSGDDFLSGALAALDALAEQDAHAGLARAITGAPRGLTSPLSECLLRAAAAGHVGESLHRAVSSVVAGEPESAIAVLRNVGHSSGWDMLAGIAAAVAAVAGVRR